MGRNRVLSFMSQFSTGAKTSSPPGSPTNERNGVHFKKKRYTSDPFPCHNIGPVRRPTTPPSRPDYGSLLDGRPSSNSSQQRQRYSSRPPSMIQTYHPPVMDVNEDTIPELQPVFTLLNSHSNKLYQEGYFLKLDDQNTHGRPNADRTWTECFAQLVGTVLSLWDAAELDAAGENGEVLPKFVNLTDASIKMIESLPTRSNDEQPLQNILSISTAGRNRYLLHFNSHHSLIQWTAGIRLAMYEHSTLQEAYTGALIAGRGKALNNINVIMERTRLKSEQWVRVRFGAGVPWRRCWCVISPPDEKEYQKMQKELRKRSPYDRSHAPVLKGDIKFYDTRKDGKKQKKAQPIATLTDAYSAYAIYPQAKSLVDASTLLKIEGNVTVHADPPSSTEGFIFIMPEVHPAVSGFEMLLRFLFPAWDAFGLYGRPGKLVASILDPRSLMFAMPKHKKYGYLEILDISNLILDEKSSNWTEREWRKRLKEATGTRMNDLEDGTKVQSRSASRSSTRLSFGSSSRPKVGFADEAVAREPCHARNVSDPNLGSRRDHGGPGSGPQRPQLPLGAGPPGRTTPAEPGSSDEDLTTSAAPPMHSLEAMRNLQTPEPVQRPPAFSHGSQARPTSNVSQSPELRRANSRLSSTTLAQMATAGGLGNQNNNQNNYPPRNGEFEHGVFAGSLAYPQDQSLGSYTNHGGPRPDLTPGNLNRPSARHLSPLTLDIPHQRSRSPAGPPSPYGQNPNSRPGTSESNRPPRSPISQYPGPRPDQMRSPPGSGGSTGQFSRGRPPPGQVPSPHGPPAQHGNFQSAPGASAGRGGPPVGQLQRKPVPRKTDSITPDYIIDHYTSEPHHESWASEYSRRPVAPREQSAGHGGSNGYNEAERPRAAMTSTGEPPKQNGWEFDIPVVNFGPTINHGAPATAPRNQAQPPRSNDYVPSSQAPDLTPGSGGRVPTPDQHGQHRGAANAPQYGGNLPAGGPRMGNKTTSPQPSYAGAGQGGLGSFSRHVGPPSPGLPPRGQYGPGPDPAPAHGQYQGQAF